MSNKDVKQSLEKDVTSDKSADETSYITGSNSGSVTISVEEYDSLKSKISDYENAKKNISEELKKIAKEKMEIENSKAEIAKKEAEAIAGFPSLVERQFSDERKLLDKMKTEVQQLISDNQKMKSELTKREFEISTKENNLEQQFSVRNSEYEQKYQERKMQTENELADLRSKKTAEMEQFVEKERNQRLSALTQEIQKTIDEKNKQADLILSDKKKELEQKISEYSVLKNDLEKKILDYQFKDERLKHEMEILAVKESEIESKVQELVSERERSFNQKEKMLNDEISRLRSEIQSSCQELNLLADVKQKLNGEDPLVVLAKLQNQEQNIRDLRAALIKKDSDESAKTINSLKEEISRLNYELDKANAQYRVLESSKGNNELQCQFDLLKKENEILVRGKEAVDNYCKSLEVNIERLTAAYGNAKDRDARIKDIAIPLFTGVSSLQKVEFPKDKRDVEIKFLENIIKGSSTYGLSFPRRLVYAFHTCLKISEWSPITVLAGVSGTGKSELPRFYSLFGGIQFLPVAVQPNWDSQEAMLGYFNSIDNKFDAQPMLRFLAQAATNHTVDYPEGLRDTMNMVLLDEMNLAHVELYFADFLSKLETRRGKTENLPCVDVKLGAGITPYQLELTRNVMWVGTMNQDETTKSLSDKVLDRGNVLFFPRPKELKSRKDLKSLPSLSWLATEKGWDSWINKSLILSEEEISPFKTIVEKINDSLATVGRALGHRVWQSIEYYMNNYPTVCVALHGKDFKDRNGVDEASLKRELKVAFEDALVQKVMPKLRGIETSGASKMYCLDKIKTILSEGIYGSPFSIVADFNLACENPFGQFIWNSANYIANEN